MYSVTYTIKQLKRIVIVSRRLPTVYTLYISERVKDMKKEINFKWFHKSHVYLRIKFTNVVIIL